MRKSICLVGVLLGLTMGVSVADSGRHNLSWKRQPSLVSRFADGLMLKTPHPEYPRPQFVRDEWMNLNGEWDFLGDGPMPPELPKAFPEKALVPSATTASTSCLARDWERGWYRRQMTVPAGWAGGRILLNFESVGGMAIVYFNGKEIGKNTGPYKRFWFEVADFRAGQENEILVHFDDSDPRIPRGKPGRLAGIWLSVWAEPVPVDYIRSFQQTPDIDKGLLGVRCQVSGLPRRSRDSAKAGVRGDLTIAAVAMDSGRPVASASCVAGDSLTLSIPDAKLWSPDSPFLYDLTLELKKDGKVVDRVKSYFGMRKIEAGEIEGVPRFLLNNELCYQVGLLDQTFWPESWLTPPSDEALKWEIEQAKEMGFNVLRKHFKVEAARWYYWCDVLGMLVWQDLAPQAHFGHRAHETEEDKDFQRNALTDMITQLYNHPSIITWVIFNEAGGQFEPREMTIRARKLDQSRLIDTCSHVWPNKFNRTRYSGDFYDYHCYSRNLGLGNEYNVHISSALGEFGGIPYRIDGHLWKANRYYGYGDFATDADDLLNHYEDLVRQACRLRDTHNLGAIIYTEITDWMGELNGFITYDRKVVKVDTERLRKINSLFLDPKPAAPLPMPKLRPVPMPATRGRFVRLELPGDYHLLSITEVEVFEGGKNIALNQKVSASSVTGDFVMERVVDGRVDDTSLAMTTVETTPWIEVDLGRVAEIGAIRVHNRSGHPGKNLDHVVMKVLDGNRQVVFSSEPQHAAKVIEYGESAE